MLRMLSRGFTAGLVICGALALTACNKPGAGGKDRQAAVAPARVVAKDVHSYARPEEARVTHVALDLAADFEARTLSGTATLDFVAPKTARQLILDTRDLDIRKVTDAQGKVLAWSLGPSDKILGRPLAIRLKPDTRKVVVTYATRPSSAALQWLSPEQTAGKKHPYLLSQGQAILTRTWVPTQDSPGIRQTYSARIVAPKALRVVMSAENLTPDGEETAGGRAWRFRMDQQIPPYLMAIAIGDIAFKAISDRAGVYTEPVMLDAVADEFADLEKMIVAAEALYGPYRWGRYDVIVLPPSFPYGGMENPRLTFATPTIVAGDRSLISLIAHELAHSWSGNLVTNATWGDFWLNEGFTDYFTNRIMEKLYGIDAASMERALDWTTLQAEIKDAGGPTAAATRLNRNLDGKDPDEGAGQIAYIKGAAFLRTIEGVVGRERFDVWLRSYFDRHAFQPITSEMFVADLRRNLLKGDKALEARLKLNEWIYKPGIPSNAVVPTSNAFVQVDEAVGRFIRGGAAKATPWSVWNTQQRLRFLGALPAKLPRAKLDDLDQTFGLSKAGNSEVRFAWLMLAVNNHYDPATPSLEAFLTSMGRRKFVLPLFERLMAQGDWGRPLAQRIYAKARPGYHAVTTGSVDPVVGKPAAPAGA